MQSLTSRVFYYLVKRQLRKLAARSGSLEQVRAARDKSSARMFKVPAGVAVSPAQLGGLPGEWLRPQGASAASVVMRSAIFLITVVLTFAEFGLRQTQIWL